MKDVLGGEPVDRSSLEIMVAMACSEAPQGRNKWTLRLLADKMVEFKIVHSISYGTVRNVVDFGAFVDIGVKQDGLVHISQMANKFVKNPLDVVSVGDVVRVKIMSIDKERNRIGLSMILDS